MHTAIFLFQKTKMHSQINDYALLNLSWAINFTNPLPKTYIASVYFLARAIRAKYFWGFWLTSWIPRKAKFLTTTTLVRVLAPYFIMKHAV